SSLPTVAPPSNNPRILASACARCQGHCCGKGGLHAFAYLSVDTLRRFMDDNPTLHPDEVLAAYLDHIGRATYQDSCVFHGPQGCTLSREMRADICNTFFCPGLK